MLAAQADQLTNEVKHFLLTIRTGPLDRRVADNVADLRSAFEEAVDDYLETCARLGKAAQQPASGKLMLRVPPEVHSAALTAAQAAGMSLNQWAARALSPRTGHM